MLKEEKEILQAEIETAREKLNQAMEEPRDMEICYTLSVELDALIEKYLELCDADVIQV